MRVLICGDRNWTDRRTIHDELAAIPGVTCVIEGEARGADKIGRSVAESLGIPVEPYPADWARYRKSAGHIRNQQMLDEGKPDYVLAFHPDIAASRGTADMVRRADKAGIPFKIVGTVTNC